MSNFPPMKPSNLAPGMDMVVIAGEYYTIKDVNGDEAGIEGRDDPLTIEFIKAYDEWRMLVRAGMTEQVKGARVRMNAAFDDLPNRIKDNLPSRRSGLVIPTIAGGNHEKV